jgi:sarcinarray family protein
VFFLCVILVIIVPGSFAAENEHGTVKAWIKLQDGEWQNASVDDVTLKVFEPFNVKVTITTKVECDLYLDISGPGSTKTYETVEGPSECGTADRAYYIDDYDCPIGWNKTYEWTVQPTGNWTEGTAPLNLYVGFDPPDIDDQTQIAIGLINAYIGPEEWEGSTNNDTNEDFTNGNNGGSSTPGFELFAIMFAAITAYIISTRKQRNRQ